MSLVAKLLKIYYASVKAFSNSIQNAVTFFECFAGNNDFEQIFDKWSYIDEY